MNRVGPAAQSQAAAGYEFPAGCTQGPLFGSRSGAAFSADRSYRYVLWRCWGDPADSIAFIGLNPSAADEQKDDPTIRRCIAFARTWGHTAVLVANLFAFRATRPSDLLREVHPVGPDNDHWLGHIVRQSKCTIACWGNHGRHRSRDSEFLSQHDQLHCLAINKTGTPTHPLYQPATAVPLPFPIPAIENPR